MSGTDSTTEWEAAQWVAQRMGDEPFDAAGFDAWLAGDPRRQPLFDTMWQRVMGPNMDQALGAYLQRRTSRRTALAGVAAALLALVGGYQAIPSLELLMAQPQDFAAPDGGIRTIALADGSRLTLAGGADVRIRYTAHNRIVALTRGTIFADVVHDGDRPFRIEAGSARIVDVGTRFEVARKPDAVQVAVEAGAVRFGSNGWFATPIDLTANEAAMLDPAGLSPAHAIRTSAVARWRSQWVEYHDAPLRQIVADLESVAPLPIRIADPKLGELRVSGRIRLTDPLGQIDNLAILHDFAVARRGDIITLSRRGAGA